MQFQIPQFIETEAKILGPLTIKQFLILAGTIGISFGMFYVFELWLWLILTSIFVGGALATAFIKINGQSLSLIALAAINFYWKPKLFLWKQKQRPEDEINQPRSFEGGKSLIESLRERLTTSKISIPKREKPIKSKWHSIFGAEDKFEVLHKITGDKEVARRIDYR